MAEPPGPLFAVPRLSGMSGARVHLVEVGGQWVIRKSATTEDGSLRLQQQIAKQAAFAKLADAPIRTPAIRHDGVRAGLYFAEMEYVRGLDAVSFLRRTSFDELRRLGDCLDAYVEYAATEPAIADVPLNPFESIYEKVVSIQARTAALSDATVAALLVALDTFRAACPAEATLCHGDLTLGNLIVDPDGAVWAVDFLDSPFEHYWQDVAKLHQDLIGDYYTLDDAAIARYPLDYLSRRVLDAAARHDPELGTVLPLLLAVTFTRIIPYARTAAERAFVVRRVDHFAKLAQEASTTCT